MLRLRLAARVRAHSRAPRVSSSRIASTLRGGAVGVALLGLMISTASAAAATPPPTPRFGPAIDRYASYEPQTTCDPVAKPGVVGFRSMVLRAYPSTGDSGIVRDCSIGGTSEHKEGRAWDWRVSAATQDAIARELLRWLLATDRYGNRHARARRLGVMYIIYNGRIWGAYRASEGWRDYPCSGTTGCHRDHVHFSFSRDGAFKRTSWWDGTPVRGVERSTSGIPGERGIPQPRG